jgi:hypothetical protein
MEDGQRAGMMRVLEGDTEEFVANNYFEYVQGKLARDAETKRTNEAFNRENEGETDETSSDFEEPSI